MFGQHLQLGARELVFCSASCWDSHLPGARHRSAYFTEEVARKED